MSSQNFEKVLDQTDTSVASFEARKSLVEKFQHFLHSSQAAVPLIVLVASVAIFAVLVGNKFFSPFALTLILQQVAITGIIGAAQTLVILTAGIDLSVGAIMVLSSVGRFITEFFRGDSYRGTDVVFSLSTSQTISVPLFFLGVLWLFFYFRRSSPTPSRPSVSV